MPATAEVIEASRARQAAGFMASQFRLARLRAVASTRSVGLVFDQIGATWTFRICTDGNANGLRRSELGSGQDACTGEVVDVSALFPGMAIGVDPRLPGPGGEPGSGDPVRFGTSDILSLSGSGTCTAGTLFLRSARGTQYAVRISNVTTRTRLLRYEAGLRTWVPGVTRQRVRIGRDVRIVAERADGLELEGSTRLAPGRAVDIVLAGGEGGGQGAVKPALVRSWYVIRVGRTGATYRSVCCWNPGAAR